MALDTHPNVVRFEGRLWVSEKPAAEALAQISAQRRWDDAQLRAQHWLPAIVVGAVLGTLSAWGLGALANFGGAIFIALLPLGFGIGAVLGAVVNRRALGDRISAVPTTPRPRTTELVRIPSAVARYVDADTPLSDLMAWSRQGFVPKENRPRP